jgi:hypothetical protein
MEFDRWERSEGRIFKSEFDEPPKGYDLLPPSGNCTCNIKCFSQIRQMELRAGIPPQGVISSWNGPVASETASPFALEIAGYWKCCLLSACRPKNYPPAPILVAGA